MFTGKRPALISIFVAFVFWSWAHGEPGTKPHAAPSNDNSRTPLILEGLTRPSKRVKLALRVPGILARRPIEEGQEVKAGQLIGELESEVEKVMVRISRLKSESEHEIRAAQANETMKQEELDRLKGLGKREAASNWEIREAEVALQLAKVQTEAARFQQQLLKEEWKRDQALLAQRQLEAPFAGFIWRTLKEPGEAVDELEPMAVLVRLDPLHVELNVPAEHFGRIVLGRNATVTIQEASRSAEVISIDPMVDAGSSTFRVKLELANKDRWLVCGVMASVSLELAALPVCDVSCAPRKARLVTRSSTCGNSISLDGSLKQDNPNP